MASCGPDSVALGTAGTSLPPAEPTACAVLGDGWGAGLAALRPAFLRRLLRTLRTLRTIAFSITRDGCMVRRAFFSGRGANSLQMMPFGASSLSFGC